MEEKRGTRYKKQTENTFFATFRDSATVLVQLSVSDLSFCVTKTATNWNLESFIWKQNAAFPCEKRSTYKNVCLSHLKVNVMTQKFLFNTSICIVL